MTGASTFYILSYIWGLLPKISPKISPSSGIILFGSLYDLSRNISSEILDLIILFFSLISSFLSVSLFCFLFSSNLFLTAYANWLKATRWNKYFSYFFNFFLKNYYFAHFAKLKHIAFLYFKFWVKEIVLIREWSGSFSFMLIGTHAESII